MLTRTTSWPRPTRRSTPGRRHTHLRSHRAGSEPTRCPVGPWALYLAARQFDKAEDEANLILKQDLKNVGAYQLLGAALIGEEKPDQALAAFSKAAQVQPNDSSNYVNMALVELNLHRLGGAEAHLKTAVQLSPKSVEASLDLAHFYHSQGKLPEARMYCKQEIKTNRIA